MVEQEQAGRPPSPGGWGYLDVFYLALFAISSNLVALVACVVAFLLLDILPTGHFLTHPPLIIATQALWWFLVLGFLYGLISLKYRLPFGPAIGWHWKRSYWMYLPWGILLAVVVVLVLYVLPEAAGEMPMDKLLQDRATLVLLALYGTLLAPVMEELLMRGFVFAAIDRRNGPRAAVLITSAIFGLMHAWQYGWRWQNLLMITCVGLALGLARARTQSVVPSTLMHTAYNTTLFGGLFAAGDELFRR